MAQSKAGRTFSLLLLMAFFATFLPGAGCFNRRSRLRWWALKKWGVPRICPELLKQSVPLRLDPRGNTIGRFFPTQCDAKIIGQGENLVDLQFTGSGYAWTPVAGRIGFRANATVRFSIDARIEDVGTYVWGDKPQVLVGPNFQITSIENKGVQLINNNSPVGYMANTFGTQIMSSQIASGFTVIDTGSGKEVYMGKLIPPQRPPKPFQVDEKGDRYVFANETTEIRSQQVEILGPFEVTDPDDQSLVFTFQLNGPPVDAFVVARGYADPWREGLQNGAPLGPPQVPPIQSWVVPGGNSLRQVKAPKGQFYLVIDNSGAIGVTAPAFNLLSSIGAGGVVLGYKAELVED